MMTPSRSKYSRADCDSRSTVYHHSIKLSVSCKERRKHAWLHHWLWASHVNIEWAERRRQTPPSSSSARPEMACPSICAALHSAWFGRKEQKNQIASPKHTFVPPGYFDASVGLFLLASACCCCQKLCALCCSTGPVKSQGCTGRTLIRITMTTGLSVYFGETEGSPIHTRIKGTLFFAQLGVCQH